MSESRPGTSPDAAGDESVTDADGTSVPDPSHTEHSEYLNDVVDDWGADSFPASDPPGYLPPSLKKPPRDKESDRN